MTATNITKKNNLNSYFCNDINNNHYRKKLFTGIFGIMKKSAQYLIFSLYKVSKYKYIYLVCYTF